MCGPCARVMGRHRSHGSWPTVTHLFDYRDEVRELIVRTKSRGGPAQFAGCVDLFLNDARAQGAGEWCDAVAAAPASFWTRIRGRPHLATELAVALARRHRKAMIHIVPPVFWRFRKHAMTAREDRRRDAEVQFRVVVRRPWWRFWERRMAGTRFERILLIDDVRTTGGTLKGVARNLNESFAGGEVRTLVLGGTR